MKNNLLIKAIIGTLTMVFACTSVSCGKSVSSLNNNSSFEIDNIEETIKLKELDLSRFSAGMKVVEKYDCIESTLDGMQSAAILTTTEEIYSISFTTTYLAAYNFSQQSSFGFEISGLSNSIFFYIDTDNNMQSRALKAQLCIGSYNIPTDVVKYFDSEYINGEFLEIKVINKKNILYVYIGGQEICKYDATELFGEYQQTISLVSKNIHNIYNKIKFSKDQEKIQEQIDESDFEENFDREALTADKVYSFANPKDVLRELADDFYLNIRKNNDGIEFSGVGFGDFCNAEFIQLIIKNNSSNKTGWKLDASDMIFRIYGDGSIIYKSGLNDFWDWRRVRLDDNFLVEKASITRHCDYFNYTFTIPYTIVKGTNSTTYKMILLEMLQTTDDMMIYNDTPFINAMRYNGKPVGDPANQNNYIIL